MKNIKITLEDVVKIVSIVFIALLVGSLVYGIITGGADTSYLD